MIHIKSELILCFRSEMSSSSQSRSSEDFLFISKEGNSLRLNGCLISDQDLFGSTSQQFKAIFLRIMGTVIASNFISDLVNEFLKGMNRRREIKEGVFVKYSAFFALNVFSF